MALTRRGFLSRVGLPATLCSANAAFPSNSYGDYQCTPPQYFNGALARRCSVGFHIIGITAQQTCDQWCWAACIESAFRLYGYKISQPDIVRKLYGGNTPCTPSIGPQIAAAVEGYWQDHAGKRFYATLDTRTDIQFGIYDPFVLGNVSRYLANEIPVIVGALGHATLLTGITWIEDNLGHQRLVEIIVRDPWPGNPNRRRLSMAEFYGTTYVAAVIIR